MTLNAILVRKREEVRLRTAGYRTTEPTIEPSDRDFEAALRTARPAFILEVKPRSPSAGPIRDAGDLGPVIDCYRRRADAVSVLTDSTFFGGSPGLLTRIRSALPQPILAKDFIIDPAQVRDLRAAGADAILLILAALDDRSYRACADQARALRMSVLTEVHDAGEMARAASLGARLIGVNSRNLRTFKVDLAGVAALAAQAPPEALVIAESGITGRPDVRRLAGQVDGFLIGSALMSRADPDPFARELIYGPTKVCGLTRPEDAEAAAAAGATHGGLVFAPSPRRLDAARAKGIRHAADLQWVGVFAGHRPHEVAALAEHLELDTVQLHGGESDQDLEETRRRLPGRVALWRAVPVNGAIPPLVGPADRWLLDGQCGGSGRIFDWGLLGGIDRPEACIVGGGLDPDNVGAVPEVGIDFFDVSSGVETSPGLKDRPLIRRFLAARRARAGRRPA